MPRQTFNNLLTWAKIHKDLKTSLSDIMEVTIR